MVCWDMTALFQLAPKLLLFYIIQYSSLILQNSHIQQTIQLNKKVKKSKTKKIQIKRQKRAITNIIKLSNYNILVQEYYLPNFKRNKLIILMSYQNNQEEECFVATQMQYRAVRSFEQQFEEDKYIRFSLPEANQLKPHNRPSQMIARVMSAQPQIYSLPSILNQPCIQQQLPTTSSSSKPKLQNKQKLTLAEYLSKKQFNLVYNKYGINILSKKSISDMTIRLRVISQISDYDWKLFKEINTQYRVRLTHDKIDSNFQCGNMGLAYCNYENQNAYYLLLEQDTNTHGYTNWFFYRFRNVNKGIRKFYILNLVKRTSFYKQGMKISTFSIKKWQQSLGKLKWHKTGNNVSFFQSNFERDEHNDCFNCLYFEYDFQYEQDQVYFAVCQPYTYTRMASLIKDISQNQTNKLNSNISWKVNTLGYSISNNIIPSVTFFGEGCAQKKKTILFMGRQHPSQMAGSFISQSLIRILSQKQPNQFINFLLNKFNIMIIPMVNPDGVIYGNSRSNFAGLDLNRHWGVDIIKQLTPQTHKIRTQLCNLESNNNNIKFLLDLHGHGKKLNTFLFCCKKQDRISNRYFPLILSKLQERFDLFSCTYGISRDKENTIRAQLYDIGIRDCYTLQNSYYGYNKKNSNEVISYTQFDYQQIAVNIIKSLYLFFATEKSEKQEAKQKFGYNIDTVNQQLLKIVDKLQKQQKNIVIDDEIMSQSDPQADGLKLQQRLKMCNNSKTLDKKIRQTYRKAKSSEKYAKSPKKPKNNQKKQKNDKVKTQPAQLQKDSSSQEFKTLEKKVEGKLVISKKLRTQNKIRTSTRQRKSMLQTKRPNDQQQAKITKNVIKSFIPLKIPIQPIQPIQLPPSKPATNTINTQNSIQKTKAFERCRIFQKLKTQISQNFSLTMIQIQKQGEHKEKMQQKLFKIKQQNLKNVVKESLLFMNTTFKNKKCKFIEDKRLKSRMSNHLIDARLQSYSVQIQDTNSKTEHLKVQMSDPNLQKSRKILKNSLQSASNSKTQSPQIKRRVKKSYQRFQAFVKNSPALNKLTNDGKGPVFYHFPMM